MADEPTWSMGVEEEYLLVERETGALVTKQPPGLMEKVVDLRHGLVARGAFQLADRNRHGRLHRYEVPACRHRTAASGGG